jgi:LEA14-like dessication related protein
MQNNLVVKIKLHDGEVAEIPISNFPAEITVYDVDLQEEVKCNILHVKEKTDKKTILIYCS